MNCCGAADGAADVEDRDEGVVANGEVDADGTYASRRAGVVQTSRGAGAGRSEYVGGVSRGALASREKGGSLLSLMSMIMVRFGIQGWSRVSNEVRVSGGYSDELDLTHLR